MISLRRLAPIVFTAAIAISGCNNSPDLKKEEALQIINREMNYPREVNYEIFCSDPYHAKRLIDAGLETEGFVTVQKTQKLKNIGKPLVQFMEKAKPYLLPVSDKEKALDVQKVKIAVEEIAGIDMYKDSNEGKTQLVVYTTVYKNATPFARLIKEDLTGAREHRAYFKLADKEWVLEKYK